MMTDTGLTWPWIFALFAAYIFLGAIAREAARDLVRWWRRRR